MWPNFATVITIIRHQHKFFCFFTIYIYISSRLFPPAFFRATLSSCLCSPWTHRQQTHGDPRTVPHYEKCVYCTTMRPKQKSASDVCSHLTLAQKLLHREVLTQGNFCTQWDICAQKPLHRGAVLRTHVYTQTLSHTHTTFAHRSFYITHSFYQKKLLHTHASIYSERFSTQMFYTEKLLFTHRNFYPKKLLHTEAFTQRRFYTLKLLHTQKLSHKEVFAQRSF